MSTKSTSMQSKMSTESVPVLLCCNFCGAINHLDPSQPTYYCGCCGAYQSTQQQPLQNFPVQNFVTPQIMYVQQQQHQQEMHNLQVRIQSLQEINKNQEEENLNLKEENANLIAQHQASNALLETRQKELDTLQKKCSDLDKKCSDLDESNYRFESKNLVLKAELLILQRKVNQFKDTVKKQKKQNDELSGKVEQLEDLVADLREMHQDELLKAFKDSNDSNKGQIDALNRQSKLYEVQIGCLVAQFRQIRDLLRPHCDQIKTQGSQIKQMQSIVKAVEGLSKGLSFIKEKFPIAKLKPLQTYGLKTDTQTGVMKDIVEFICTVMGRFAQIKLKIGSLYKIVNNKTSFAKAIQELGESVTIKCSNFDKDVDEMSESLDNCAGHFELVTSILDESSVQYNHLNCKLASAMYHKILKLMKAVLKMNTQEYEVHFTQEDHKLVGELKNSLEYFSGLSNESFFHLFIAAGANHQRFNEIVFSCLADDAFHPDFVLKVNELYMNCRENLTQELLTNKNDHKKDVFTVASTLIARNEHVFLEKAARAEAGLDNFASTLKPVINEQEHNKVQQVNLLIKQLGKELSAQIDNIKS